MNLKTNAVLYCAPNKGLRVVLGCAAMACAAPDANAWLGGFESGDGYGPFLNKRRSVRHPQRVCGDLGRFHHAEHRALGSAGRWFYVWRRNFLRGAPRRSHALKR